MYRASSPSPSRSARPWPGRLGAAAGMIRPRMLGFGGAALALLVAPLLTANTFVHHLLIMTLFAALLGAAWNLLGGYAGQVSFGHAAFLGLGAYTTMLLHL